MAVRDERPASRSSASTTCAASSAPSSPPEFARALGRAFASARGTSRPRAGARRRSRQPALGPRTPAGRAQGIVDAGGTAVDVGALPTPALYFAVSALEDRRRRAGHGVPQPAGVQRLQDGARGRRVARRRDPRSLGIIVAERWRSGTGQREHRRLGAADATVTAIVSRHTAGAAGAASWSTAATASAASSPSPRSGRWVPRSRRSSASRTAPSPTTIPIPRCPRTCSDLQAAVRRTGRSSGIAFDGDADRIGAVDETGRDHLGRPAARDPADATPCAASARARRSSST